MFRESDYHEKHLHPTYSSKPVPALQILSQGSKFEGSSQTNNVFEDKTNKQIPAAVPSSWDSYYDPNHPDADWTGLVSKSNNHRKHMNNHPSQHIGITQTEHGIVSAEERQEWTHKRQPENRQSKNDSTIVLSGVNADLDRWKTTYKSFEAHDGTTRDQMTLEKRVRPVKRIPDPAQARSQRDYPQSTNTAAVVNSDREQQSPRENGGESQSLVGYRAPVFTKKSMISGLGADIASRIDIPAPVTHSVSKDSKAPDTLLTQNYNPHPGKLLAMIVYNLLIEIGIV